MIYTIVYINYILFSAKFLMNAVLCMSDKKKQTTSQLVDK